MKLIKENSFLLLMVLFIFLGTACHHISEQHMALGKWKFVEVSQNDTPLYPLLDTDFLELNTDSSFHYEITMANKNMRGTWHYQNHQLYLKYIQPDTTRIFDIEIISKFDLIFNEKAKHFVLKRLE